MQGTDNSKQTKLSDVPQHSYVTFSEPKEPNIFFNSKFDSGNLATVHRNSYDHYSIWTAPDAAGTENEGYPKSWFYFEVGGFKNRRVSFSIHRVHFLWALTKKNHLYRPVYRLKYDEEYQHQFEKLVSEWKRLPYSIISLGMNSQDELVLKFDFAFVPTIKSVQFAFIYPYSHEDCHRDMMQLKQKYQICKNPDIFLKQYELCRSYEGRLIDMVIISSHEGKEGYENIKTDNVFTLGQEKLVKFRNNKPIIFISARVHPIETPSSFTMTGIINYLLDKEDYRAYLLRKYFVFILVPMLNVDGVSNGHCRMDALNQNLNRYYKNPDPIKQPSCYSVKKLCEHYTKDKRLFMYLDLHAHPAHKGNFIFGNAIFDYIEQVESHLFPKILSQNCINFEFEQCIFSRKHMKAKDRNEDISKEGCGRVVFYKEFGLTHAYTLECGYHCNTYNNTLEAEKNPKRGYIIRYRVNNRGENIYDNYDEECQIPTQCSEKQEVIQSRIQKIKQRKGNNYEYKYIGHRADPYQLDDCTNDYYDREVAFYQQKTFYNLGRNICISILDVWNKNPYTRIINANEQRKQIAERQAKLDRFRKEQAGIKTKQKRIVELIETQCYEGWHKRNVFLWQTPLEDMKKTSLPNRMLQKNNNRVTEKSLGSESIPTKAEINFSHQKILLKNQPQSRKTVLREQKKINLIHPNPNIETVKTIGSIETTQITINNIKSHIESRNLFKPINMRIRNLNINK